MDRRTFLMAGATAAATATAGCLGDDDTGDSDDTGSRSSTENDGGNGDTEGDDEETEGSGEEDTEGDDEETEGSGEEDSEGDGDEDEKATESEVRDAVVLDVLSAETVEVEYENGETEAVRLAGVHAPSTNPDEINPDDFYEEADMGDDTDRQRQFLADIGEDAEQFMRYHLWHHMEPEEVEVEFDPETPETDADGNPLVFLHWESPYGPDGDNQWHVNVRIIAQGYARATDTPSTYKDKLQQTEATARTNNSGYWDYRP